MLNTVRLLPVLSFRALLSLLPACDVRGIVSTNWGMEASLSVSHTLGTCLVEDSVGCPVDAEENSAFYASSARSSRLN